MVVGVSRAQVLGFRVRAQQLDGEVGRPLTDAAVLRIGVQDSRTDGGLWSLANRGVDVPAPPGALVLLWTLRGAPHFYRRDDLPRVARAVAPMSDADAGNRVYQAAKPLRSAGIGNLEALDTVAAAMRSVVVAPMVKGEVSTRVTPLVGPPFRLFCRGCGTTHVHEMLFRLAALRAGVELQAGTSPPVLQPIQGWAAPTGTPTAGGDVVGDYLRLLGPATPKHVAEFLDAPVADVKAQWPADATEVAVDGERRWVLADDEDRLQVGPAMTVRLLAPYDLFLQARDRSLLVDDPARSKALWPTLGRPGAVFVNGEIAGLWRPRTAGKKLRVQVQPWSPMSRSTREAVEVQAQRLAAHRGVVLAGVEVTD